MCVTLSLCLRNNKPNKIRRRKRRKWRSHRNKRRKRKTCRHLKSGGLYFPYSETIVSLFFFLFFFSWQCSLGLGCACKNKQSHLLLLMKEWVSSHASLRIQPLLFRGDPSCRKYFVSTHHRAAMMPFAATFPSSSQTIAFLYKLPRVH